MVFKLAHIYRFKGFYQSTRRRLLCYATENSDAYTFQNISVANGIALSTDEKVLWVTKITANRLHRIALEDDGVTIQPFGATIPYYFTGHEGPDSCCIDSDDNLYVAMYRKGDFVAFFNKRGYPIGQILIPGRDEGHMLRYSSAIYTWNKSTHHLFQ